MYGIDATSEGRVSVTIGQVVLIPHTHHDVGYTNSPRVVDGLHREIVGEVLRLAEAFPTPGPEQFRWTFEVARPVLAFLRGADPAEAAARRPPPPRGGGGGHRGRPST